MGEVDCLDTQKLVAVQTTITAEDRDMKPPSEGNTTWDLRLRGRDGPHREDTNCSLLLLTLLWWEAPKYSMNIKQACQVGSPA